MHHAACTRQTFISVTTESVPSPVPWRVSAVRERVTLYDNWDELDAIFLDRLPKRENPCVSPGEPDISLENVFPRKVACPQYVVLISQEKKTCFTGKNCLNLQHCLINFLSQKRNCAQ